MIDMLLEKYLMGFMRLGHQQDVFVNPTKKEIRELKSNSCCDSYRFIADAKKKKLYAFNDDNYHRKTWDDLIRKEIGDNRKIYEHASLFAGTVDGSTVINWGFDDGYYHQRVIEEWVTHPDMFDWAGKWVNISGWFFRHKDDLEWETNQ